MLTPLSLRDALSFQFWGRIWATYSLYDPSYSNRQSFGFFIDVGNGWTTLVPTLVFQLCMTNNDMLGLSALHVGLIGLISCYQAWYGTVIYFLSYIMNQRYKGRGVAEVVLFVGLTNGTWFIFPLLSMVTSYTIVATGNFDCLRS